MTTDNDGVAYGYGRRAEQTSGATQDEAEELAISDGDLPNQDVNDGCSEEASAGPQHVRVEPDVIDGPSGAGKRKPDVEVLAKGVASLLGPVMNNFDGGVEGILKSQSILARCIDHLAQELDKMLEDVPHSYSTHHATRLSGIRKRVIILNKSLHIIQKRMGMIHRVLACYGASSASRASTSANQEKPSVKGFHSTSHDVYLMEILPRKGSCWSADTRELPKDEDLNMSNLSGIRPSGGLQDVGVQAKRDSNEDLAVNLSKEVFIDRCATIARAGESDEKKEMNDLFLLSSNATS